MKCGFQEDRFCSTANNLTERECMWPTLWACCSISTRSPLWIATAGFFPAAMFAWLQPGRGRRGKYQVQTAGESTKFGILLSELEPVKEVLQRHDLRAIGLHMHTAPELKNRNNCCRHAQLLSIASVQDFPDLMFVDLAGFGCAIRLLSTEWIMPAWAGHGRAF